MTGDIITFDVEKRKDPRTEIEVTRLRDKEDKTSYINSANADLYKCIWSDR